MKDICAKLPAINIWLSAGDAGDKISMSRDTVEKRGVPWSDVYVPYKIRYKELQLDANGKTVRRYFEPDVEACLKLPSPRGKKRQHITMVPDFVPDSDP